MVLSATLQLRMFHGIDRPMVEWLDLYTHSPFSLANLLISHLFQPLYAEVGLGYHVFSSLSP